MKSIRGSPTAFRFDPRVKDALATFAEIERRSMANMLDWLIKQHYERASLSWPPAGAASSVDTQAKPTKAASKVFKVKINDKTTTSADSGNA